jgi:hypothetical protein
VFDDATRLLVGKLKQQADFDALIVPSLCVQRAILSGTKASWDGSERTLEIETRRGGGSQRCADRRRSAGGVATRRGVQWRGAKLHEGRAGLGLLVRGRISPPNAPDQAPEVSFAPLRDPFEDRAFLMPGTAKALVPYVLQLPAGELSELSARIKSEPPAPAAEGPPVP